AYIWDPVKSIATPNAQTLVFTLKYPAPLDLIASSGYAAYIYDTKAAGTANLHAWFNKAHDAGTGPYTIFSWSKGQENELRLSKFTSYWGGWKGTHYTSVLFKHVPTPTTRAQLVQSGGVTYTDRLSPQLFASMKGNSAVKTTQGTSFQNLIAFLNTASGPLANTHVRQAVADAIDYKGIVAALKGSVVPASGFIPKGLIGYTPGLGYTKNLTRAKALLARAGYGPGKQALSLDLTIANGDADEQLVATIIKADLAALNIKVQVQALEWTTQWDKAKSKNPAQRQDIFVMYWWPDYADPFSWFINLFHSADPPYFNMSYLKDKAVDTSIDKLEALTATRRSAAVADYKQLQHRLISQAVAIPLYVQKYERVFSNSVGGYVDNPAYPNVVFVYDLRPKS
ncbi:MAG TPA: ABC transporter substrate-binding protein, partial [Gaiellaceae bacterium]|nr:ABC transporter substrate-binding protein [Gaiellaceae bacterium]